MAALINLRIETVENYAPSCTYVHAYMRTCIHASMDAYVSLRIRNWSFTPSTPQLHLGEQHGCLKPAASHQTRRRFNLETPRP